jgi:hypothetical protein
VNYLALNSKKLESLVSRIDNSAANPSSKLVLKTSSHPDATILMALRPGQRFKGSDGKDAAAIVIQKNYKRYKTRQWYLEIIPYIRAAKVFLKYMRIRKRKAALLEGIGRMSAFHLERADKLKESLVQGWSTDGKRTIILLPSVNVDPDIKRKVGDVFHLQHKQFIQSVMLSDPNVSVIFVTCRPESEELAAFRKHIFDYMLDQTDKTKRLQVIVPENLPFYRASSTVTGMLLRSEGTLTDLKSRLEGLDAYIMGGSLKEADYILSSRLKTPLLAPNYHVYRNLTTLSYCRDMFQQIGLPVAPAIDKISEKGQFYEALAELLLTHPSVKRWLFKIEQRDSHFQGLAWIDSATITETLAPLGRTFDTVDSLSLILPEIVLQKTLLFAKHLYGEVEHYIEMLCRSEGTIEALMDCDFSLGGTNTNDHCMNPFMSSVLMHALVQPSKAVQIRGSTELLMDESNNRIIEFIPQLSLSNLLLREYTNTICEHIASLGYVGYISVIFSANHELIDDEWMRSILPVRIMPNYNAYQANLDYLTLFTDSFFDTASGALLHDVNLERRRKIKYINTARFFDKTELNQPLYEERHAVFCDQLVHTNWSFIPQHVFSSLIQTSGVGFDIGQRIGTKFMSYDKPSSAHGAIMCVRQSRKEAMELFASLLPIIDRYISSPNLKGDNNFKVLMLESACI